VVIEMMRKLLVKVLIRSAIAFEEASYRFYREAGERASSPEHKHLFSLLAGEEVKHKEKLQSLTTQDLEEVLDFSQREEAERLDLPDVKMPHKLGEADTPQKILLLAMDRESAACSFYHLLAERSKIPVAKKVFNFLASEEEEHKSRIEKEYRKLSS
jgi:rubrerythrin